ncbi:MAG: hypothetical protein RL368_568, partial [Pseudomonadota bacterium]
MQINSPHFKQRATIALQDMRLQKALSKAKGGFIDKRLAAISALPEFEALRERGKAIKQHT